MNCYLIEINVTFYDLIVDGAGGDGDAGGFKSSYLFLLSPVSSLS